jgi:hypothetical protein
MLNGTQTFKVVDSGKSYGTLNTSYLSAYSSVIDNLSATNVGSEWLFYKPPNNSTVYSTIGYSPIDFYSTSTKTAYFLNTFPGLPAVLSYGEGVLTLPSNAFITKATLEVLEGVAPVQSPYRCIMLGTQPVTDLTPLISGDIVTGDSVHFISGESFTMYNTPMNRGQSIGGFLTWPLSQGIPSMAVTVGVDFVPDPAFTSGNFSLSIEYIIL